ncbi:hypothetical protein K227x_02580 [Rubripirellula lacrimiformis]|uniref:Uncharacterized protein n=1 Tax=Rubripirellula lacrimiformis TaxID=1930273 RepID=A0A517N420_9BACT|nr:hypothetical protein [Rubripirellula lacrimiformis]QDT01889.1 hypothetical protein K227x_02580 [Rubripirellula lacrimiformis]
MKMSPTLPRYLMRWNHREELPRAGDVVTTDHRLGELSVFTDLGLASIIDRYPRSAIEITMTGTDPSHPSELQYCDPGTRSGLDLIQILRGGQLVLTLKDAHRHVPFLGSMTDRLIDEYSECRHLGATKSHQCDVQIRSPDTQAYLSIGSRPSIRWQVRGSQQIRKYPFLGTAIDPNAIGRKLYRSGDRSVSCYFEPAMDDCCDLIDLDAGQMFAVSPHQPSRSIVGDSLSVSITTRYVDETWLRNRSMVAGHDILRQFMDTKLSIAEDGTIDQHGVGAWCKRGMGRLASACRCLTDERHDQAQAVDPTFRLDPVSSRCITPTDATRPIHSQDGSTPVPYVPFMPCPTTLYATET